MKTTLRALIKTGLRRLLFGMNTLDLTKSVPVDWVTASGSLEPVHISNREAMYDWIEDACILKKHLFDRSSRC